MADEQGKLTPFDFVNAIHMGKNIVTDDYSEKQYSPFLVNKALSFGADTIIPANEMNCRPHIDRKGQSMFLAGVIHPRKRYNKWMNKPKISNMEMVMEYYQYGPKKAIEALRILSKEQLKQIEAALFKGGLAPRS